MAVCLINPSFTLDVVGEGEPIPWCKEKVFRERLRARGLKESPVSKVWYNNDGEFVQFASPMFQTDDILTFPNGVSEVRNSLP